MDTIQKGTAATQQSWYPFEQLESQLCDMPKHLLGKHSSLKFSPLFISPFPSPPSPRLPPYLQAEICFSQLLLCL